MCVLVIGCTSPRLHLEKILIFSSILLNHKQPIEWEWCAFQTQRIAGWIVAEENNEESEAIVCLSSRVSEESIVTITSVGSLSQSIWRRRGLGAINRRPQRREREGWSRIELRILDSRVPQSVYQRKDRLCAHLHRCIIGMRRATACRLSWLPTPQHHQRSLPRTRRGDLLLRGFWGQAVCELIERGAVLIKEPAGSCAHARACSYIPTPLSTPFTQFYCRSLSSFYFMVSVFKGLSFVLWKAVRLSRPFVEWTYCWIVEIVSCTETLAKS